MICPYCKKEMEKGYIPSGKMAIMWIPENGKLPATVFHNAKRGVQLTKVPFWKIQKAEAYYCGLCKVIIVPVKDLDSL